MWYKICLLLELLFLFLYIFEIGKGNMRGEGI